MKIRTPPIRATATVVLMSMALILAGCATATRVPTASSPQSVPSNDQANRSTPTIPPGQRLEKFILCYELRGPRASPLEPPIKHFSIDVSILVPQDDCLALDSKGWLRVVPGQCSRMPAKIACED